jgi:HD-GYP domain-containing protein (c-di-GMP phosphodiesterase class II)
MSSAPATPDAPAASVLALKAALDARDRETGEHSQATAVLAVAVAGRLGLDDREVAEIARVALLHDVGNIGVPDAILYKRGPLDTDEWTEMRRHPVVGERIIAAVPDLETLANAVRAEHERWDGGGYPDGLAGEGVPLASRIVLACDAFLAMTERRPYRRSLTRAAARAELQRNAGTQFDPAVVEALLAVLDARARARRR